MDQAWPDAPYAIAIFRREKAPIAQVWAAFILQPLPTIPIPLLPEDRDVAVPLQPIIDGIYQTSRYFDDMKYDQPIRPALSADEARHVAEFLSSQSGR